MESIQKVLSCVALEVYTAMEAPSKLFIRSGLDDSFRMIQLLL